MSDDNGGLTVAPTALTDADLPVFDPARTPIFQKVAPNGFAHPVDALKRYLSLNDVTAADHDLGRMTAIDPVPVSEFGGPGIVQPTRGAGATWLEREFVTTDGQNQQ
jgi:sulfur-oxidizing protein SoxB